MIAGSHIGIWKRITPGLRSEQEQVSQAEAVESLQTLPKFSQDLL
jgi:hypothetical protein